VLCYDRGRHAVAAQLYAEALKADPKLCDDRRVRHRYDAACAAALAGGGQGKDDPPPDEAARAGLRKQALGWLEAELAAWGRILGGGDPKDRARVVKTFQHWKVDRDLAGVRDPDALSKVPAEEQPAWRALWAEVDALLEKARGRTP
jgi:hypothetical protein